MSFAALTNAVLAAAVGAIAAGVLKWVDGILDRRRQRESTLVAIASEVRTICDLIRHQGYFDRVHAEAEAIRKGQSHGSGFIIDIRSNYFSVYEALSGKLGILEPSSVPKIVSFYAFCKSAIDSTRPDGPVGAGEHSVSAENLLTLEGTFSAILALGDEIQNLPKNGRPEAFGE